MYKKTVLKNGLKIITHRMPSMKSVSLGLWVGAGGRYENEDKLGISHFLEHMAFKGTKKRTCDEIKEAVEGIGGSLNAFTSEEFTCFLTKARGKFLQICADTLSDIMLNPKVDKKDVETERFVILEEAKMYNDLPHHFVNDRLNALLWPGDLLGKLLVGTPRTIKSITAQDILDYRDRLYAPNNITAVAAGLLEHEKVVSVLKDIFEKIEPKKIESFRTDAQRQTAAQLDITFRQTQQTNLAIGYHALSRQDPKRYVLGLLHIILGANMSSRLFKEVREKKGLAYAISSSLRQFKNTGAFVVSAGVDDKKAPEALAVIIDELARIKKQPPDKPELRRAKEFYAGQLLMALEDTMDHMSWLGEHIMSLKKLPDAKKSLERIEKIKIDEVVELSEDIFEPSRLNAAVIGPLDAKTQNEIRKKVTGK